MNHTPLTLTRAAAEHLREKGFPNARLEAELLLAAVLEVGRLDLYLQHDRPLTEQEIERFRGMIRRRLHHEPVQYILGEAQFRELHLAVDRRVLIPRPETEVLAGEVLQWAEGRAGGSSGGRGTRAGLAALEVGTGSGAIALSLAKEGPFAQVVATDVSREALDVAKENMRRAGLSDDVDFRCGPLWEPLAVDERFDVIVSNPPYVSEGEWESLEPEVRDWEPATALVAGVDGLAVLDALVRGSRRHLEAGGLLALEVGADQARGVAEQIESSGEWASVRIGRDLAGRERMVLALATQESKSDHERTTRIKAKDV